MPLLTIIPVVLTLLGAISAGIFVLFKKFKKKESNEDQNINSSLKQNQTQKLSNEIENTPEIKNIKEENPYENLSHKSVSSKNPLILQEPQLIK
jgi:hypothetical protein